MGARGCTAGLPEEEGRFYRPHREVMSHLESKDSSTHTYSHKQDDIYTALLPRYIITQPRMDFLLRRRRRRRSNKRRVEDSLLPLLRGSVWCTQFNSLQLFEVQFFFSAGELTELPHNFVIPQSRLFHPLERSQIPTWFMKTDTSSIISAEFQSCPSRFGSSFLVKLGKYAPYVWHKCIQGAH